MRFVVGVSISNTGNKTALAFFRATGKTTAIATTGNQRVNMQVAVRFLSSCNKKQGVIEGKTEEEEKK